ncbi:charged multivesicular body protein 4b-like [Glandiceps talaboti]
MSFLFGKSKKEGKAPSTQEAIQKLRETEELLEKKQEYLEKKIQTELSTAKKHGTKNKRVAIQALKRKKKFEKQLQQIDGTLSTIEFQREALESASTNTEVLKTMGYAAKALKSAHQHMDVDDVHDMMDDIQEQQELADEVSNAISQPLGFQDVDDDDLMAELEELEQEELDDKLLEIGPTPVDNLPSVPSDVPKAKEKVKEEDDDMSELAAWAS